MEQTDFIALLIDLSNGPSQEIVGKYDLGHLDLLANVHTTINADPAGNGRDPADDVRSPIFHKNRREIGGKVIAAIQMAQCEIGADSALASFEIRLEGVFVRTKIIGVLR